MDRHGFGIATPSSSDTSSAVPSAPDDLIKLLQRTLQSHADPQYAQWYRHNVKPTADVRGVRMQDVRHLVVSWNDQIKTLFQPGPIPKQFHLDLLLRLFHSDYVDDRLSAMVLLNEVLIPSNQFGPDVLPHLAPLFSAGCISDFKACEHFAAKVLQPLLIKHRAAVAEHLSTWLRADNVWQARAALATLLTHAADAIYEELLLDGCRILLARREEEAKAIVGSALRAIGKAHPVSVLSFLREDVNLAAMNTACFNKATNFLEAPIVEELRERKRVLAAWRVSGNPNPPPPAGQAGPGPSTQAAMAQHATPGGPSSSASSLQGASSGASGIPSAASPPPPPMQQQQPTPQQYTGIPNLQTTSSPISGLQQRTVSPPLPPHAQFPLQPPGSPAVLGVQSPVPGMPTTSTFSPRSQQPQLTLPVHRAVGAPGPPLTSPPPLISPPPPLMSPPITSAAAAYPSPRHRTSGEFHQPLPARPQSQGSAPRTSRSQAGPSSTGGGSMPRRPSGIIKRKSVPSIRGRPSSMSATRDPGTPQQAGSQQPQQAGSQQPQAPEAPSEYHAVGGPSTGTYARNPVQQQQQHIPPMHAEPPATPTYPYTSLPNINLTHLAPVMERQLQLPHLDTQQLPRVEAQHPAPQDLPSLPSLESWGHRVHGGLEGQGQAMSPSVAPPYSEAYALGPAAVSSPVHSAGVGLPALGRPASMGGEQRLPSSSALAGPPQGYALGGQMGATNYGQQGREMTMPYAAGMQEAPVGRPGEPAYSHAYQHRDDLRGAIPSSATTTRGDGRQRGEGGADGRSGESAEAERRALGREGEPSGAPARGQGAEQGAGDGGAADGGARRSGDYAGE